MLTSPGYRKRQRALKIIEASLIDKRFSVEQKKVIKKFYEYLETVGGNKITTIRKDVERCKRILLVAKEHPEQWTSDTIIEIFKHYSKKTNGEPYAISYRNLIRVTVRKILVLFKRRDLLLEIDDEFKTSVLSQVMKNEDVPIPSEVYADDTLKITQKQKKAVLSKIQMYRAKIFWTVQFDTGARPDDLRMLTLKDVKWTDGNTRITLMIPEDTKTGSRPVRVLISLPELRYYLNKEHPLANRNKHGEYLNRECAVFLNSKNEAWGTIDGILDHLRRAVLEVRNEEQNNPDWDCPMLPDNFTSKLLRKHVVIQHLKSRLRPDLVAEQMGHSVTVMLESYNLINKQKEVEIEFDRLVGFERDTEEEESKQWLTCATCSHINQPLTQFCGQCGTPLSEKAQGIQDKKNEKWMEQYLIMKLPEELKKLREKEQELEGKTS